jgi:hypothetical protein
LLGGGVSESDAALGEDSAVVVVGSVGSSVVVGADVVGADELGSVVPESVGDAGSVGSVVGSVVSVGAADELSVVLGAEVVASSPPAGTAAPVTADRPPPELALVPRSPA